MIQKQVRDKTCGTVMHQDSIHKRWRLTLILALCAGFLQLGGSGVANAAGGYVGVGIGNAWSTFDKQSFTFDAPDLSSSQTIWHLFGGYQLSNNVGIEGGYIYLGKARVGEQARGDYFEATVTGFELTPVGLLPVGKHFSVFARGGLIFWHSDMTSRSADLGSSAKTESGSSLALGFGVKYDFSRQLGMRAEYTRYAIDKTKAGLGDFNVISVNGVFAFSL